MVRLLVLLFIIKCGQGVDDDGCKAQAVINEEWPVVWQGRVEIIQHLVDKSNDYPPWKTVLDVKVDGYEKVARIETILGENSGQILWRRYPSVQGTSRGEEFREYLGRCEHALLYDDFPYGSWPKNKTSTVEQVVFKEFGNVNHVDVKYNGELITTYRLEFLDFEIPRLEFPTASKCESNVGGWAYVHLLHDSVKI